MKDKIFDSWKTKNKNKKDFKRTNETVNTFYGKINVGAWSKKFHWVHYKLKYKIVVPAIKILYRWSKKKLEQGIPQEPQYKYARLWNDIFDEATLEWRNTYLNPTPGNKGHQTKEQIKTAYNAETGNTAIMRKIKEITNTLLINDDAYVEWLPFFLWTTYFKMKKEAEDNAEAGKVFHLLHSVGSTGTMDPVQEIIYLKLVKTANFGAIIAGKKKEEKK